MLAATTPAHEYATAGTYVTTLTVTDDEGAPDLATLSVTIAVDLPTVAVTGPDQAGTIATTFSFDGSASTDDHGIVAWRGDFGDGNTATTETATHMYATRATFTAILTVWDTINQFDTDTLMVGVGNRPRTANAGSDQRDIIVGALVTLSGTLSADPDGDPLTYAWTRMSGPAATLESPGTATPTFTPTVAGTYVFSLTVSDGTSASAPATVSIVVAPTIPPAQDVTVPVVVGLLALLVTLFAAALAARRRKQPDEEAGGEAEEEPEEEVRAEPGEESAGVSEPDEDEFEL